MVVSQEELRAHDAVWQDQLAAIHEAYDKGMKNTAGEENKRLIDQLAVQLNLEEKVIKVRLLLNHKINNLSLTSLDLYLNLLLIFGSILKWLYILYIFSHITSFICQPISERHWKQNAATEGKRNSSCEKRRKCLSEEIWLPSIPERHALNQ